MTLVTIRPVTVPMFIPPGRLSVVRVAMAAAVPIAALDRFLTRTLTLLNAQFVMMRMAIALALLF